MTKKSRKKYHFYYDESGHDKKITENAISRQEYFDNFVVAIVGWSDEGIPEVQSKFSEFEIIHENRRGKDGEIKSLTIKPKQLRYGLASLSDDNVSFLSAYTGLNLPHAREKPATSPENFRHLAGEGCQCKRETTYCEEHTKNV